MAKRPLYVPGRRPFYDPATGRPLVADTAASCACCETLQAERDGYVFCGCCVPQDDCDHDVASGAGALLAEDYPAGPGVYRTRNGACYRVLGPIVRLPPGTNVLRPGIVAGPFATCAACEGDCGCADPTHLVISFGGWEPRTQSTEATMLGARFWGEISVLTNPLSGSYVVPANLSALDPQPEIVLQTFPDAVVAVGPYGEWGRNDLELVLLGSSVDRCLGGEPPLCLWRWRLRVVWTVRPTNVRTTDPFALIGPGWPYGRDYPGGTPYGVAFASEVVVPCDEGGTWCACPPEFDPLHSYGFLACPGYDPEVGPDGGCGAWANWPGCPASPRLYRFHRGGCVTIVPLA